MPHKHKSELTFARRTAALLASLIATIGLVATPVWASGGILKAASGQQSTQVTSSAGQGTTSQGSHGPGTIDPDPIADGSAEAAEKERVRQLGIDPSIGNKYRPEEAETAQRIEKKRGVRLHRADEDKVDENSSVDWYDDKGNTYDAVGNFSSKYFEKQWPNLKRQIDKHLEKAFYVPVDVSKFGKSQRNRVKQYLETNPQFDSRVFVVGDSESSED